MRVWLVTEWRERRQRRREWEAEGKTRDERHEALMESAVVLAVEEARSEALPGMRPRVDIEDVVAVLDRPGFEELGPSRTYAESALSKHIRAYEDVDSDVHSEGTGALSTLLRITNKVAPENAPTFGPVEIQVTGPAGTVEQIVERLVEAVAPLQSTPVTRTPAHYGAAMRARFRVVPPESGE